VVPILFYLITRFKMWIKGKTNNDNPEEVQTVG
jgi:hypothetical protein